MSTERLDNLVKLEGHHVGLVLADGTRIDDWELVSIGGGAPDTAWVWNRRGRHAFVPLSKVVDFWEVR